MAQENDFLTDYSLLEKREGDLVDAVYIAPNVMDKMGDFNAIMVDQPEIFFSPDTKYKGAKPDQLKALADTSRLAMMERLEAGGYNVTDTPGASVMLMHWAITDVYLKKKKRGILSYTPVGFVVHSTKQAAIKDLWKKIDIIEMGIEMELTNSATGEILAAGMFMEGHRKDKKQDIEQDPVTWEELDAMFSTIGERVRCNLDNARLAENAREDCAAILIEPEYPEES